MHYVLSTCVVARKLSGIGLPACAGLSAPLVILPHSFMDRLPFLLLRLCGLHIGLAGVPRDFAAQLLIALPAGSIQFARIYGAPHCAAFFHHATAITETPLGRQRRDLRKGGIQAILPRPQLQLAHSWRVDERAPLRQRQQLPIGGRMPAAAVAFPHLLDELPFHAEELI